MTRWPPARGQALPLALGLAAVGAIALVMLYNGGQTVAARVRLTHAADAAAYSGALVQARALNLLAYINRTQVAHQVAMAHLVTLATWAQFGQAQAGRLKRGNPPGMLIAMLYGPAHGLAYASSARAAGTRDALPQFAAAHARHDVIVHDVLARATQETLRTLPASRQQAIQAVFQANYPEFTAPAVMGADAAAHDRLSWTMLADTWPGFVSRYAGHAGGAFRPLVLRATDHYGFLGPRRDIARNAWPVSMRCPMRRHQLRRRGGTTLGADGNWQSIDTQSHHALRSNKYIGCYYREYAMGWGKLQTRSSSRSSSERAPKAPTDFSSQSFWRWVRQNTTWDLLNGMANPLAYVYSIQGELRWKGRGMPAYAEIPIHRIQTPARFELALRQPAALIETTDAASRVAAPIGRFAYAGLAKTQGVTVASAAETYFARPAPRRDGQEELATLFRPYWQARLVPPTSAGTRMRMNEGAHNAN